MRTSKFTDFKIFQETLKRAQSSYSQLKNKCYILRMIPDITHPNIRSNLQKMWGKLILGCDQHYYSKPIFICINSEVDSNYNIKSIFKDEEFYQKNVIVLNSEPVRIRKMKNIATKYIKLYHGNKLYFKGKDELNNMITMANGDIRSLLNMIYLKSIRMKAKKSKFLSKGKASRSKQGGCESTKNQSKSIFQRVGRILYCKCKSDENAKKESGGSKVKIVDTQDDVEFGYEDTTINKWNLRDTDLKDLMTQQSNCHFGHDYFRK